MVYFCFKTLVFGYIGWVLEENMPGLCIRGFNCQALIRDLLVFQQFLTKSLPSVFFLLFLLFTSLLNLCILQALCSYIWEISLFSLQKWLWGYFAKGILQNFAYFPTKIICFMCIIMFVFYQSIA